MVTLVNRAKVATATTGTGTITLGAAESGYQTFADAGVANADVVRYVIEDGTAWEIGTGTYTATGTTLTRTVSESSNADAAIVLTGSATVFIGATAEDIPSLYAENPVNATDPSVTGQNAIAIGSGAAANGNHALSLGHFSTADTKSVALGASTASSGNGAVAIGYQTVAAGDDAVALGRSRASGVDSFAVSIDNNTSSYGATNANSVAIGYRAKASGQHSLSLGYESQATGLYSIAIGDTNTTAREAVGIGENNSVGGMRSTVIGYSSTGTADYSTTLGAKASDQGIKSRFAFSGQTFNNAGDSQQGMFPLRMATTDATATALTTDIAAASTDNQIILPNNSAYFFSGTIIAREQAASGTDVGAWEIKGAIRREANAASTVLVKSTIDDFNVPTGWAVALTADTTNGGLAITVTGAAATNIRWVATVTTSEVTY